MKNNRSVSAAIGEYLTLGELLKRDVEAYLAHGETQKGWDIMIVKNDRATRVQVKTIDWPDTTPVNGKFAEGFDFLVVVLLDREHERSRFFIFPVEAVAALLSAFNKDRKSGNRTITMSKKAISGPLAQYEDNWSVLL